MLAWLAVEFSSQYSRILQIRDDFLLASSDERREVYKSIAVDVAVARSL